MIDIATAQAPGPEEQLCSLVDAMDFEFERLGDDIFTAFVGDAHRTPEDFADVARLEKLHREATGIVDAAMRRKGLRK